jgi:hypothetical protein
MLPAVATLLTALHFIGAVLGAGGVTYAEVAHAKAIADGKVERREYEYFAKAFWALRWGMTTVLLSGLALLYVQYFLPDSPDAVLYSPLWMQNTLVLAIIVAGAFMARRAVPWWLGSSLAFAGWWMMLILDLFALFTGSYLMLLFIYAFAVFVSAAFWGYVQSYLHERAKMHERGHHNHHV